MKITIRDVAKRLNLSITTVSRALDGYDDVAQETRRLVEETAREMGYVPNQAARQLRRQRSDTLGYILPADKPRFADPFFAEFVSGLGDEAALHGFDLLISSAPAGSHVEQQSYARWVQSRKVDGVVLNRLHLSDWRVQYLNVMNFPFVTQGKPGVSGIIPHVQIDNRGCFARVVEHLLTLGHRRIAYIGADPGLQIEQERFQGFQDGLARVGLTPDPELVVNSGLTSESGYQAALQILQQAAPPSAITCVDDMTALGVMHAARDLGLTVGKNLAVTGFDGIAGSEHTQPPLTTINQPVYQIARQLAAMLINLVSGKPLAETSIQMEAFLEVRQSTTG